MGTGMFKSFALVVISAWLVVVHEAQSKAGHGEGRINKHHENGKGENCIDGFEAFESADVPQYWITDAAIFIRNGVITAQLMLNEQELNIVSSGIIKNQAQYLSAIVSRALSDLRSLSEQAMGTNPEAVPSIQDSIAHLVAAQAQTDEVVEVATILGPTYGVTLRSALDHLRQADVNLTDIAQAYDASNFISTQSTELALGTMNMDSEVQEGAAKHGDVR